MPRWTDIPDYWTLEQGRDFRGLRCRLLGCRWVEYHWSAIISGLPVFCSRCKRLKPGEAPLPADWLERGNFIMDRYYDHTRDEWRDDLWDRP